MSDRMHPISFEKMIIWVIKELKEKGSIFGIHKDKFYKNESEKSIEVFGENLSSPLGPAAGPNTQLTQNIVSAYLTGSRFIELKTVQVIDGEDLAVAKPCICAQDECYNVEWSTELKVSEAFCEYIKAWFLLHILMKELNLSKQRDFMFNMSVGYDLDGIKSPKMNNYIEGMRNASNTKVWNECKKVIISHMNLFSNFNEKDLEEISPIVCSSITVSTLHGCPPEEIEKISNYLLKEKNLNVFIKMNPTLLGEKFVRNTLNTMGYGYITLNGDHFKNDLQYGDAVTMLQRLKDTAKTLNLEIGVKLTNTLPVKIENKELPGEEMYMSGRSLFPLTISLASRLAEEFGGDLQVSYSGGADFFNVDKILTTGIQPVTFATTILKPGGYERITQMAQKVERKLKGKFSGIDTDMLSKLAEEALKDDHHLKNSRTVGSRKLSVELPTYDCMTAPCSIGCPINQQIPEYVALVGKKKYDEAFSIIAKDNASPAITATICNHNCQFKCTRLDYDSSVLIRDMKKIAVLNAEKKYIKNIKPQNIRSNKKVAVIGAGPAGLSTALFLRRNGMDVTVMDKKEKPYGVVRYVIPDFRIPSEMIDQDFELVKKQGVKFEFGINGNFNIDELKGKYDYIILAIGAWKPGKLSLKEGKERAVNAIAFLERYKAEKENINLGKHVCIIGGGNVAMDAARAAKRIAGVETVSIVYRRTKEYMPADSEELKLAISDGIVFKELLAPIAIKDNKLLCEEMILGEKDTSGRRSPVSTGKEVVLDADTVIAAVGEKVDSDLLKRNGIELDSKDFPKLNEACETNISNVYIPGDAKCGPATIVKAIADGKAVAKNILSKEKLNNDFEKKVIHIDEKQIYSRKGILKDPKSCEEEYKRCLSCSNICELCVDVCPNRANVAINVGGGFSSSRQVIHLDGMCNECGNCGVFCPYKGNPYKDKVTVFWNENDFENSTNKGFCVIDIKKGICKVREESGKIAMYTIGEENIISKEMECIIKSCIDKYSYML
ncbi:MULTISPECIES: putative selenate reductase subunit YgfK [Clostridium]|uniref:Glutamate synthase [NADPH] small chain n=3 Tax=Clostridium TaxID=1485 RepID=D8GL82_CLOLD|nr:MULTISPECIES: putative selenate reductase subunit YgfK [Clostridium]ADK15441.1 predicted oxidoreductase, Fe-S subunit [Clostridium ljungdahlii DSM 13528]AGY74677.1 putative selenate reductase subunit YgfK [Clostridium autoethanogenum DSM 10061]ALU34858.1 putative selenate reductase YgfK [Clostridium autoethanogenum DSM 10061]OAA88542.1 Glutamate synthase [NADPH] small chain [Clostridium ljungdahlii DSM 13528]OAA92037.1 Glutamate synthase [NADPH] small chain [Clostridium coskatii]